MATYHPAYLLRNYTPDNRRRVWEDMKKVLVELGLPVPETRQRLLASTICHLPFADLGVISIVP